MESIMDREVIPLLIPIIAIVCGCTVAAIGIIAHNWRRARKAELDASLKAEMLRRGMSVDEIERVLKAGRNSPEAYCDHR